MNTKTSSSSLKKSTSISSKQTVTNSSQIPKISGRNQRALKLQREKDANGKKLNSRKVSTTTTTVRKPGTESQQLTSTKKSRPQISSKLSKPVISTEKTSMRNTMTRESTNTNPRIRKTSVVPSCANVQRKQSIRSSIVPVQKEDFQFRALPLDRKVLDSCGDRGVPKLAKLPLTKPRSPKLSTKGRSVARKTFDSGKSTDKKRMAMRPSSRLVNKSTTRTTESRNTVDTKIRASVVQSTSTKMKQKKIGVHQTTSENKENHSIPVSTK